MPGSRCPPRGQRFDPAAGQPDQQHVVGHQGRGSPLRHQVLEIDLDLPLFRLQTLPHLMGHQADRLHGVRHADKVVLLELGSVLRTVILIVEDPLRSTSNRAPGR